MTVLKEKGLEVISVDIEPKHQPTFSVDILAWDFHIFPPKYFDVICAGVPCTEYSIARQRGNGTFWVQINWYAKLWILWNIFSQSYGGSKTPEQDTLPKGNVSKISHTFMWSIVNFPTGGTKNLLGYGDVLIFWNLVTECATREHALMLLWGRGGRIRHKEWLGRYGMKFTTQQKWRMPKELVELLLSALSDKPQPKVGVDFAREDYTIKWDFLRDIERRFGVETQRDCFASAKNARCTKYFSRKQNAMRQSWDTGEILWLNPPWSLWPRVVKKL